MNYLPTYLYDSSDCSDSSDSRDSKDSKDSSEHWQKSCNLSTKKLTQPEFIYF